jgi:hypothetical protein
MKNDQTDEELAGSEDIRRAFFAIDGVHTGSELQRLGANVAELLKVNP